jgi:hypothetical protein
MVGLVTGGELILVVTLGVVFLFVIAIYLFVRRTIASFREGIDEGR